MTAFRPSKSSPEIPCLCVVDDTFTRSCPCTGECEAYDWSVVLSYFRRTKQVSGDAIDPRITYHCLRLVFHAWIAILDTCPDLMCVVLENEWICDTLLELNPMTSSVLPVYFEEDPRSCTELLQPFFELIRNLCTQPTPSSFRTLLTSEHGCATLKLPSIVYRALCSRACYPVYIPFMPIREEKDILMYGRIYLHLKQLFSVKDVVPKGTHREVFRAILNSPINNCEYYDFCVTPEEEALIFSRLELSDSVPEDFSFERFPISVTVSPWLYRVIEIISRFMVEYEEAYILRAKLFRVQPYYNRGLEKCLLPFPCPQEEFIRLAGVHFPLSIAIHHCFNRLSGFGAVITEEMLKAWTLCAAQECFSTHASSRDFFANIFRPSFTKKATRIDNNGDTSGAFVLSILSRLLMSDDADKTTDGTCTFTFVRAEDGSFGRKTKDMLKVCKVTTPVIKDQVKFDMRPLQTMLTAYFLQSMQNLTPEYFVDSARLNYFNTSMFLSIWASMLKFSTDPGIIEDATLCILKELNSAHYIHEFDGVSAVILVLSEFDLSRERLVQALRNSGTPGLPINSSRKKCAALADYIDAVSRRWSFIRVAWVTTHIRGSLGVPVTQPALLTSHAPEH